MVATPFRSRHRHARRAALLLVAALVPLAANAADNFRARLSPVPIDPATAPMITGLGSATAELDGTTLKLSGSFSGLKGPATLARLHDGVATGVRGPAIADFTVPQAASGNFTAELTLTAAQAESVRRGKVYIQIHSSSAPDGNLWGWLLQ